MKKPVCAVLFFICIFAAPFAQTDSLAAGLEAYSKKDWNSAMLFFRRAVSIKETASAEAWYWLIMSEESAGKYESAVKDADIFLSNYKKSEKYPNIMFERGFLLYKLGKREESIKQLYDFLQQFPSNQAASSAYYWIAQSLYDMGYYSDALLLYNKIVKEYESSEKYEASAYKIALIEQRSNERELLLLLKETHETALRASDEFERKTRMYEQTILSLQKRIEDLSKNSKTADLEAELSRKEAENVALQNRIRLLESNPQAIIPQTTETTPAVTVPLETPQDLKGEFEKLKQRALQIQQQIEKESGAAK